MFENDDLTPEMKCNLFILEKLEIKVFYFFVCRKKGFLFIWGK